MCTALTLKTKDKYFGRTLDLDRSYGEEVCIMPRKFPLAFKMAGRLDEHFAIIGMATVVSGVPLYYDAVNEHGLAMAGLNFPENAFYFAAKPDKDNIAPFELLPWILGRCKSVADARALLSRINITDISFSDSLPNSPLHFMICGDDGCLTVESMRDGLHIFDNTVGVLTNNPPFEYQVRALRKYKDLRADNLNVKIERNNEWSAYCQGLGALGLPGDVSSMSRFARIAFGRENSVCPDDEYSSVSQFFHLLDSVAMLRGVCVTDEGGFDITGYTSCMNTDRGLYYYTTYENRRITCVDLHAASLDGAELLRFPLLKIQSIEYQNR